MIYLPTLVEYDGTGPTLLYDIFKKTWFRKSRNWGLVAQSRMYNASNIRSPNIRVHTTPIKTQDKLIRKYIRETQDEPKTRPVDIETHGYIIHDHRLERVVVKFGVWYGSRDELFPTRYYPERACKVYRNAPCARFRSLRCPDMVVVLYEQDIDTEYPFEYRLDELLNPEKEQRHMEFEREISDVFLSFDVYPENNPISEITRIETGLIRKDNTTHLHGYCFRQIFRPQESKLIEYRNSAHITLSEDMVTENNKDAAAQSIVGQILNTPLIPL